MGTPGGLAAVGALALGAVWGHLLGLRGGRAPRTVALELVASGLVAAEAALLAGRGGAAAFALAVGAVWAAGALWRRRLSLQAGAHGHTR